MFGHMNWLILIIILDLFVPFKTSDLDSWLSDYKKASLVGLSFRPSVGSCLSAYVAQVCSQVSSTTHHIKWMRSQSYVFFYNQEARVYSFHFPQDSKTHLINCFSLSRLTDFFIWLGLQGESCSWILNLALRPLLPPPMAARALSCDFVYSSH